MQNPIHEVGETARGIVDALRTQPAVLALIIVCFALLGFIFYDHVTAARQRATELQLLYDNRKFVGELLFKCAPAPQPKH